MDAKHALFWFLTIAGSLFAACFALHVLSGPRLARAMNLPRGTAIAFATGRVAATCVGIAGFVVALWWSLT